MSKGRTTAGDHKPLPSYSAAPVGALGSPPTPKDALRTLAWPYMLGSHPERAFTARPHFSTIYWFVEFNPGPQRRRQLFPDPNFPCLIAPSSNGQNMTKWPAEPGTILT